MAGSTCLRLVPETWQILLGFAWAKRESSEFLQRLLRFPKQVRSAAARALHSRLLCYSDF